MKRKKTYGFSVILTASALSAKDCEALYEAGCDDGTIVTRTTSAPTPLAGVERWFVTRISPKTRVRPTPLAGVERWFFAIVGMVSSLLGLPR